MHELHINTNLPTNIELDLPLSTTPPTGFADFIASSMPQPRDPSNWLSASMPKPADTTTTTPSESPPPRTFLLVADQSYPVVYEDHTPATNIVSDNRPQLTVAIVTKGDNALALMKTAILKGTVALLQPDNRTLTMQAPTIESIKYFDAEYREMPKSPSGSRILVLRLSCDSRGYRST
jgi:hypothetical protein